MSLTTSSLSGFPPLIAISSYVINTSRPELKGRSVFFIRSLQLTFLRNVLCFYWKWLVVEQWTSHKKTGPIMTQFPNTYICGGLNFDWQHLAPFINVHWTHWDRGGHFADDILKPMSLCENVYISLLISLKFLWNMFRRLQSTTSHSWIR